jgi:hypothetical protein
MASSKYLGELIRIARDVMPSLQYDLQNASTTFSLQAACQKMFDTLGFVLHHCIQEAAANMQAAPVAAQPVPQPTPIVRPAPIVPVAAPLQRSFPAPQHLADAIASLPPPPALSQPLTAPPAVTGMPDVQAQPGVASVFITSQGTQVIAPGGAKTVLPPGAAVDLAASAGLPPELPPAPPGVEQIVLPPGGGMSPELAAALATRSTDVPTT